MPGSTMVLAHDGRIRTVALLCLCLVLLAGASAAQLMVSKPVKLIVEAEPPSIRIGERAQIKVFLADVNNQKVKAPKMFVVKIEVRFPSGRVEDKYFVTFNSGEDFKELQLPLNEAGIIEIRATYRELREGGTLIKVTPVRPSSLSPAPTPPQMRGRTTGWERLRLMLRNTPQRRLLADGKDAAEIYAFLVGDDWRAQQGAEVRRDNWYYEGRPAVERRAPTDIEIRLFNNGGQLSPQSLLIRRGDDSAKATLISDQVGTVTVEYVSSTPAIDIQGAKDLQIMFGPPITKLDVRASPPDISLMGKSDLIVRLLDEHARSIATDKGRHIAFAIDAGQGAVVPMELQIPPEKAQSWALFLPTWKGEVRITASTPGLADDTVHVQVLLPFLLLSLSGLGGLMGGLLAFLVGQKMWWRIMIGLVTGFVLYWAFIFGVLPLIQHGIVLNPLSAVALSTLGGWLGTEVFTLILKRLGLAS